MAAKHIAYLALAALLAALAVYEMVRHGGATWLAVAFVFIPDVALIYGAGPGLERGQLHPRAVRFYNALHSFVIPAALVILGIWLPPVVLAGGLAWGAHIALDRGLGFGTRTREGFQRQ